MTPSESPASTADRARPGRRSLGITFPINDGERFGPGEVRTWLAAAEACGYDYVSLGDHTLGMEPDALSPAARERWVAAYPGALGSGYSTSDVFHEPLVLGAFIAGAGSSLGLATGVVPLPQRQTVLFAKQAAELDVLCGGRLRLGLGVGWNAVEFAGMGADFAARQAVFDEQLELLRLLLTQDVVTYEGRYHALEGSGIQLRPVQRPVPVFLGGDGPRTLRRVGRVADGWHPAGRVTPGAVARRCLDVIAAAAVEVGRDPAHLGLEVRLFTAGKDDDQVAAEVGAWAEHHPSHVVVDAGARDASTTLAGHVRELERVAHVLAELR